MAQCRSHINDIDHFVGVGVDVNVVVVVVVLGPTLSKIITNEAKLLAAAQIQASGTCCRLVQLKSNYNDKTLSKYTKIDEKTLFSIALAPHLCSAPDNH